MSATYARCPICGDLSFPVHALLPCGHEAKAELHDLSQPGAVYSWTRSHQGGESVLIVMADFLGGDLRVAGPVPDVDQLDIGDRLLLQTREDGSFILTVE